MASSKEEGIEVQHQYHFRYDRRLSCFSNAVSCLSFTGDGQYLVSGTGSGDIKGKPCECPKSAALESADEVWDCNTWAEAAKLKGGRRAEPKEVAISPSQRWVVVCYSSVLHIYQCGPPWRLVQSRPVVNTLKDKEPEWCCVAFSPSSEVDHPTGHAGQDNNLAAFSNCSICLMDYSGGWEEVPQRTRSIMQTGWPASLAYTGDGYWIVCGFSEGQMQVWNAFSLTLEKTLNAHEATVTSLAASPPSAPYDQRVVSCSKDQCLRVWHVNTWLLEQHLHELRCDRSGLRRVTFSASGQWLIAVSSELTVWRVCVSPRTKKFDLQLHQRLEAICGAESVRTATFSSQSDVVAVGSHDGILGLWNKHPGLPPPPDAAINEAKAPVLSRGSGSQSESTLNLSKFTRMQKITPEGVKPLRAENQKVGNRARAAVASPLPLHHSRSMGGVGARLSLVGTEISGTASGGSTTNSPESTRRQVCKTSTLLGGWQPSVLDEVFSQAKAVDPGLRPEPRQRPEVPLPNRELMARARGLVKRIALDPKVITDPKAA